MGCGGSKDVTPQRRQPEGNTAEETPAAQGHQGTDNTQDTTVEAADEPVVENREGSATEEQTSSVPQTWQDWKY